MKFWQIVTAIFLLFLLIAPISAIQTDEKSVTTEKQQIKNIQNFNDRQKTNKEPGGFLNTNCILIVFGRPMPYLAPELDRTDVPFVYEQIKFWMETGFCFTIGAYGMQYCGAPYCGTTDHNMYIGLVIPFGGLLSWLLIGFTSYVYVLYGES